MHQLFSPSFHACLYMGSLYLHLLSLSCLFYCAPSLFGSPWHVSRVRYSFWLFRYPLARLPICLAYLLSPLQATLLSV